MLARDEDQWSAIRGHEDYLINPFGGIIWFETGKPVKVSKGAIGLKVNLRNKRGAFTTKSVARLVAEAFVPRSIERYDTIIHLDGDRTNCTAYNLMWRSRSYAVRYHRQFHEPLIEAYTHHPVVDEDGQEYRNVAEVAHTYGLLYREVVTAIFAERPVYLTGQQFYWLD